MPYLPRIPLLLVPKQPFIDWANSDDDPEVPKLEPGNPPIIYLVTMPDELPSLDEVLDAWWETIFEEQLEGWMRDMTTWPVNRTREMFDAWFEVSIGDAVIDLAPDEPLSQAEEERADTEHALRTCAWCDLDLGDSPSQPVGFPLTPRDAFSDREGCVVDLVVKDQDGERMVTGIVPTAESEAKTQGFDLLFTVCTTRCRKGLTKAVTKALRHMKKAKEVTH